ncbi:MAG: glycoside hydrolase family 16 protein, partial [Turicibacter sp.]
TSTSPKPVAEEKKEEVVKLCRTKGYELPETVTDYELVWSDEFDVDGLPDEIKWSYDTGGHGWGNEELQYYTEGENVKVEDGLLVIEARREAYEKMDYTSTRLVSRHKGDFTYGKFEISAKLPQGRGTWPAIWMLPSDWKYGDWPISGEIDIMEHVGADLGMVHGSIHTSRFNHKKNTQKTNKILLDDASDAFHVYGLEWLPDKIIVSVDGEDYFTFEPGKVLDCPTQLEWPFDQDFHVLLNLAVGGMWGGMNGVDEEIWPKTMEVDYVRVYQSQTVEESIQRRGN